MKTERLEQTLKLFGEVEAERVALGVVDKETKRNTDNLDLFEAMLREAYDGVTMVVAGHHIMAVRSGEALPIEISSADTLIFSHEMAQVIWKDRYKEVLTRLATEPTATRDALLRELYFRRVR